MGMRARVSRRARRAEARAARDVELIGVRDDSRSAYAGSSRDRAATRPSRDVGVVIVAGGSSTRTGGNGAQAVSLGRGQADAAAQPADVHGAPRRRLGRLSCCRATYAADPPPWIFQCDVDRLMVSTGGRTRTESVSQRTRRPARRSEHRPRSRRRASARRRRDDRSRRCVRARGTLRDRGAAGRRHAQGGRRDAARSCARSSASDSGARRRRRAFRARSSCARIATRKPQHVTATDDAALCERLGIPVNVVRGSERAMKITEEADFARAEALFTLPE